MKRFMLDTNIASHVIRGDIPLVRQKIGAVPMESLVISSVTQAELLYGVAKRGHPKALSQVVQMFLERVEVLDWSSDVAKVYGELRAKYEAAGTPLSAMDMMIAAHAKTADAVLVSRDRAFRQKGLGITVQDWAEEAAH
jgi:tRNA(fMet)-specific endonuclease VapC